MSGHHLRLVRVRVTAEDASDRLLVRVLRGVSWRPVCSCGADLGTWLSRAAAARAGRDHIIGGDHA